MRFVYPSASSSDSINPVFTRSWDFDGVVRGVGRKWKRSDSSDSDSVALMTRLTTLIFDFHKVINALTTPLTTPTPTPSLVKTSRVEITFCSLGANHAKLDAKFENTAVFPALLCMFSGFRVLLIQKHFSIVLSLRSRCNYFCKPRRTSDFWERICLFFYKREWSRCSSFLVSEKLRVESAFALSRRNGLRSMSAFNVCNVDVYRENRASFFFPLGNLSPCESNQAKRESNENQERT